MLTLLLVLTVVGVATGLWFLASRGGIDAVLDDARDRATRLLVRRPSSQRVLPGRLLAAAMRTVVVGVAGTPRLPERITIAVHPEDLRPWEHAIAWLGTDVAAALHKQAQRRGWVAPAQLDVEIVADPERPWGAPRATGEIGGAAPAAPRVTPGAVTALRPARATVALPSATRTAAVATLRLVSEHDDGERVAPLAGERPLVVGRDESADLVVDHPTVSRLQCELRADGPVITVRDLGSTNGTFVDGRRVDEPTTVRDGAQIGFGSTRWSVTR